MKPFFAQLEQFCNSCGVWFFSLRPKLIQSEGMSVESNGRKGDLWKGYSDWQMPASFFFSSISLSIDYKIFLPTSVFVWIHDRGNVTLQSDNWPVSQSASQSVTTQPVETEQELPNQSE